MKVVHINRFRPAHGLLAQWQEKPPIMQSSQGTGIVVPGAMTPGGRVGELEVAPELLVGSPRDHHGPCLLDSGWFQKGIYLEYTRVACNCVLQKETLKVAIIVFDMENYCLWRNNPIEPYRMRRDRCLPRALRKLVCLGSRWCRRGRRWCRGRTLWRDARIISGQGGVRIRATLSSWAAARVFLRQLVARWPAVHLNTGVGDDIFYFATVDSTFA